MNHRVGSFDYGLDNLHSTARVLVTAGGRVMLIGGIREPKGCNALVVPGVGAYAAYMAGLWAAGGVELLADRLPAGKPLLGICVGHQILLEEGTEHGIYTAGLGFWPGTVRPLTAHRLSYMGQNRVDIPPGSHLFAGVEDERFYFVYSYAATRIPRTDGALVTTTTHEVPLVAIMECRNVCSTQFHPEKFGEVDARLLRNWLDPRSPQDAS